MSFVNAGALSGISWQGFERLIARILIHQGYTGVRSVGASSDGGADVIGNRAGKRWLFQAKRWNARAGNATIDRTLEAMQTYRADIPVVVSLAGFESTVVKRARALHLNGLPIQLWGRPELFRIGGALKPEPVVVRDNSLIDERAYQQRAITKLVEKLIDRKPNRALIVMATGLGKTFVAAESIRRYRVNRGARLLAIAHTNPLVDQLERAFWPFLTSVDETLQWNGIEKPSVTRINAAATVFACMPSVVEVLRRDEHLKAFDVIMVDECHHGAAPSYLEIFERLNAGQRGGPFLIGLTATPWHENDSALREAFGEPIVSVDIVDGLRNGFLTNVDYRLYTDNINWDGLRKLHGERFSPRLINKVFFLPQWDEGVVSEVRASFESLQKPRAIVFCATIEHAIRMRDLINSLRFCRAEAIYSGGSAVAPKIAPYDRSRLLCDFQDDVVNCICTVDIFNEGLDVPDVNIIMFQRVTHSRRIFVQQLGRGLRLSPGKDRVIVLDFVSDIRRFAAGIDIKDALHKRPLQKGSVITLPSRVTFCRVGGDDPETEEFLRRWLMDIAEVEGAGDDSRVLRFPPLPALRQ